MGKFLEHLMLEDDNKKDKSYNTDPHEIMTAFFCSLDKSKFSEMDPEGMSAAEADKILNEIFEGVKDKKTSKIVGQNDLEINAVLNYKDKYGALAAAYSAAKEIRDNFKQKTSFVILTGRKWTSDIEMYSGIENLKAFGIDSYGMKDFNSSDIVLTDKQMVDRGLVSDSKKPSTFLGVSLKKTGSQKKAAEPTRLNRSVEDALAVNDEVKREIQAAFNEFFNETIKKNASTLLPTNGSLDDMFDELAGKKSSPFAKMTSGKEVEKWFRTSIKELNGDSWKKVLSDKYGLMSKHPCKDTVREVMNAALKNKGSVFEKLQKVIERNSDELALALIQIIYKGSLSKLIANYFDFGVCIGKGSFVNKKCNVAPGKYEPIKIIENVIESLRHSGTPNMKVSKKQKPFDENQTAAKLFFDLRIDEHPLANIEVRYKGSFTSSPQFFAVMAPEFKNFLDTGKWQ